MFWHRESQQQEGTSDLHDYQKSAEGIEAYAPVNVDETGLPHALLQGLLAKHLLRGDVMTLSQLSKQMALRGSVVQELLAEMKETALVENRQSTSGGELRYSLSGAGRQYAMQLFEVSGYLGPAPVPVEQYRAVCSRQSSRHIEITKNRFDEALGSLVLPEALTTQLGPALNSKRPILIYGLPGTGKSYLCRHLNQLFTDEVLVPHAISVGSVIIRVFDPHVHVLADEEEDAVGDLLARCQDRRWYRCERPLVTVGGELSRDMLDVHYEPNSRTYLAPIGLKANNGILLVDDLGRQVISPKEIFNRWILPLEEARDFLSLPSGEHFEVPFEQLLLFSTNLAPTELVDDAFLRRLGYKIHFGPLDKATYRLIWRDNLQEMGLEETAETQPFLFDELYTKGKKPLLPCHPRDLLSIVADQVKFTQSSPVVTRELLNQAWDLYFVRN